VDRKAKNKQEYHKNRVKRRLIEFENLVFQFFVIIFDKCVASTSEPVTQSCGTDNITSAMKYCLS